MIFIALNGILIPIHSMVMLGIFSKLVHIIGFQMVKNNFISKILEHVGFVDLDL
jgi:hypothetical protein